MGLLSGLMGALGDIAASQIKDANRRAQRASAGRDLSDEQRSKLDRLERMADWANKRDKRR